MPRKQLIRAPHLPQRLINFFSPFLRTPLPTQPVIFCTFSSAILCLPFILLFPFQSIIACISSTALPFSSIITLKESSDKSKTTLWRVISNSSNTSPILLSTIWRSLKFLIFSLASETVLSPFSSVIKTSVPRASLILAKTFWANASIFSPLTKTTESTTHLMDSAPVSIVGIYSPSDKSDKNLLFCSKSIPVLMVIRSEEHTSELQSQSNLV